jgi:hypothetical protein
VIDMPAWARDRVVLVGDTAYCAMAGDTATPMADTRAADDDLNLGHHHSRQGGVGQAPAAAKVKLRVRLLRWGFDLFRHHR